MNYEQWRQTAAQQLNTHNPDENGKIDAMALLQAVTHKSRAAILAFNDTTLTDQERSILDTFLQRRLQGEPIAYIVGEKEFWSLPLKVSADTLIPRPDTEILVERTMELALARLVQLQEDQKCQTFGEKKSGRILSGLRILDLGTGTGAIALALAAELEPITKRRQIPLEIVGVDNVPGVVELAQQNALSTGLSVRFLQSDWFDRIESKFDFIVANPPYIAQDDLHLSQGDVRFEPRSALVATEQGYGDLRHIITAAPAFLKPNGWLLLEHGWQQGEKVRSIFQKNLWYDVATIFDYGGNERVTLGRWKR